MSTYIEASKIVAANLTAPNKPKEIISPSKNGQPGEKYTRTYMQYNYMTPKGVYAGEALFELQICKGKVKRNKKGVPKLNLTISDKDDLAGLAQLGVGFANVIYKWKGPLGNAKFDPNNPPSDFRGAFFYPVNEETGEPIEGALPIVSLKLNEKSKFRTLKVKCDSNGIPIMNNGIPDVEEESIDYTDLLDKTIECGVIFNARDLYRSAGSPLPQLFVRSCMVLNITDSGDVEHTKSAMVQDFLRKNPEALNTLAEQIAKMKGVESSGQSLLTIADNSTSTTSSTTVAQETGVQHQPPVQTTYVQEPQTSAQFQVLTQPPVQTQQTIPQATFNGLPMMQSPMNAPQFQYPGMPVTNQGSVDLQAFLSSGQPKTM